MKALLVLLAGLALAQPPARKPLELASPVQDKSFYVLSLMERTPAVRDLVGTNAVLAKVGSAKREGLARIARECKERLCYTSPMKWTDAEMREVEAALRDLYRAGGPLRKMADGPLRESGAYERHRAAGAEEMLAQAWLEAARRANLMIEQFGEGKPPRYAQIDSPVYDVSAPAYLRTLSGVSLALDDAGPELFFEPSTRFALMLMDANHRDEAGRYEPLYLGENAATIRRIRSIRWGDFPYTVIVVPGAGGQRADTPLSPAGKLRCMLAAKRYRDRKAPLLFVSGGHVHPNRTPYAEALEMKRTLVRDFGVPADAILVDPHARHTTTNLRNAVRQIYRYGIPWERKALITTDPSQSADIEGPSFRSRCERELGYQPIAVQGRVSQFDLEMIGKLESLHIDPLEMLDP